MNILYTIIQFDSGNFYHNYLIMETELHQLNFTVSFKTTFIMFGIDSVG